MSDQFKYYDKVEPKMIASPYDGSTVRPKLQTKIIDGYQITEAHWTCPTTGRFIRKGTVEVKKLDK